MSENKRYKIIADNFGEYSVLRHNNSMVTTEIPYKAMAELFCDELNELNDENEYLKQFLKQSYDELKYFTGLFEDNEIDVTVNDLLRNLDLILDNDNMSLPSFFNYLINENKQFDADSNDCGNHFDYSLLLSRYEADVERNEIIEYNKHKDNAQYRSLDMIAGELNFKQLQIEGCRKACENLIEENERLKEKVNKLSDNSYFKECDIFDLKQHLEKLIEENWWLNSEIKKKDEIIEMYQEMMNND